MSLNLIADELPVPTTPPPVPEFVARQWQPAQIRFIGADSALATNSAVIRHVESIDRGITYVCGDEGFSRAFSSSPAAQRRFTGLLVLPSSLDKESVSEGVPALFHGKPDELVFQIFAGVAERTDDTFGINQFLEYAYRTAHHVTCAIVAGESDMYRTIASMLGRWRDPLRADERDRLSMEYDLRDRSSELRNYIRSRVA